LELRSFNKRSGDDRANWEPVYYEHIATFASAGKLGFNKRSGGSFNNKLVPLQKLMPKVLKEYRVHFENVPAGEKAVPDDSQLGIRSKLGGEPDWCQGPEHPTCSGCYSPMSFVAQIDSIEHFENHNPNAIDWRKGQEYMFGDVGMIYVFFCYDCLQSQSVFQCG